jgi:hypothetical protein
MHARDARAELSLEGRQGLRLEKKVGNSLQLTTLQSKNGASFPMTRANTNFEII